MGTGGYLIALSGRLFRSTKQVAPRVSVLLFYMNNRTLFYYCKVNTLTALDQKLKFVNFNDSPGGET
ncbi:hypothetical protein LCR01_12840 [Companilactobacillus crustorum]|uniref:Uncharacterized protein n=2 Tax=Companilactobacillus TaxID=2767879 RepID=A0A2P4R6Z2_9LACO|nr:hypothetical protein LCR01_12840 [Companilactobacillus crustorum]